LRGLAKPGHDIRAVAEPGPLERRQKNGEKKTAPGNRRERAAGAVEGCSARKQRRPHRKGGGPGGAGRKMLRGAGVLPRPAPWDGRQGFFWWGEAGCEELAPWGESGGCWPGRFAKNPGKGGGGGPIPKAPSNSTRKPNPSPLVVFLVPSEKACGSLFPRGEILHPHLGKGKPFPLKGGFLGDPSLPNFDDRPREKKKAGSAVRAAGILLPLGKAPTQFPEGIQMKGAQRGPGICHPPTTRETQPQTERPPTEMDPAHEGGGPPTKGGPGGKKLGKTHPKRETPPWRGGPPVPCKKGTVQWPEGAPLQKEGDFGWEGGC